MQWTEEQLNQLAPNDSTERRARQLVTPNKWKQLGTNYEGIWGACTGSGAQPYQVQVYLSGPRFKCSCPVRKLPCKHSLALLYLYVKQSALFKHDVPAPAIAQWLQRQGGSASSSSPDNSATPTKSAEAIAKAERAKERRWEQRLTLMQSGIDELEQWLKDLIRQGIANTEATHKRFWDQAAAKMVDAQLPAVSSYLKETYQILHRQSDWSAAVVERLGVLYSWVMAFQQREVMPEDLQQALYARLGKTTTKAQVITQNETATDTWLVAGIREGEDVEGRAYRKVWLLGLQTQRWALVLEFSFNGMPYEHTYPLGSTWQGTFAFYSTAYPQRATWVSFKPYRPEHLLPSINALPLSTHLQHYSQALRQQPWLSEIPLALADVRVQLDAKQRLVLVSEEQILPCQALPDTLQWTLLALSGGHPIDLVGEWNGQAFLPLSWLDELGFVQHL